MMKRKAKKAIKAMASTGSGNTKKNAKKQLKIVKKGGGAKKPMMGHKKPKMGHKKK